MLQSCRRTDRFRRCGSHRKRWRFCRRHRLRRTFRYGRCLSGCRLASRSWRCLELRRICRSLRHNSRLRRDLKHRNKRSLDRRRNNGKRWRRRRHKKRRCGRNNHHSCWGRRQRERFSRCRERLSRDRVLAKQVREQFCLSCRCRRRN